MGLSSHKTQILESALYIVIFLSGPVWPIPFMLQRDKAIHKKKKKKKNH